MTLGSVMLDYASSGAALWTSRFPSSETSGVYASLHVLEVFGCTMHRQLCCCFQPELLGALEI